MKKMIDNNEVGIGISKRYLNVAELAEYIHLSKWTIYDLVSRRKIPFIPFGRAIRFDVKAIDDWMKRRMVKSVVDEFDLHKQNQ